MSQQRIQRRSFRQHPSGADWQIGIHPRIGPRIPKSSAQELAKGISPRAPTRLASSSPRPRCRASYTVEPTQLQARWSAETLPRRTPATSPKRTARSSESADALGWAHVPAQATRATQESSLRRRSPACERKIVRIKPFDLEQHPSLRADRTTARLARFPCCRWKNCQKRPRQRSTARQKLRQHGARAPCSQFTKSLGWSRYRGISNAVASRSTRIEIDHQIVNPDLQKITSQRE